MSSHKCKYAEVNMHVIPHIHFFLYCYYFLFLFEGNQAIPTYYKIYLPGTWVPVWYVLTDMGSYIVEIYGNTPYIFAGFSLQSEDQHLWFTYQMNQITKKKGEGKRKTR